MVCVFKIASINKLLKAIEKLIQRGVIKTLNFHILQKDYG